MAYCIIKKNDDKFEIKKWGVINLSEPKAICNQQNKKNKQCTLKAVFTKDDQHYCKKHSTLYKKHEFNITVLANNANCTCCYINNKEVVCGKKSTCYITDVNKTYCSIHGKSEKNNMLYAEFFSPCGYIFQGISPCSVT